MQNCVAKFSPEILTCQEMLFWFGIDVDHWMRLLHLHCSWDVHQMEDFEVTAEDADCTWCFDSLDSFFFVLPALCLSCCQGLWSDRVQRWPKGDLLEMWQWAVNDLPLWDLRLKPHDCEPLDCERANGWSHRPFCAWTSVNCEQANVLNSSDVPNLYKDEDTNIDILSG